MLVVLGLILMILLGILTVNFFLEKENWLERLVLGYGLGLGFSGFIFFIMGILEIPLTALTTLSALGLLNLLLIFLNLRLKKFSFKLKPLKLPKFSLIEKLMMLFLLCLFIWVLIVSLYWPIHAWDAISLYDFRGKLFSHVHSISLTTLPNDSATMTYLLSYPFNLSLIHTFIYLLGGSNPQFIYAGFYIALIITFFISARRMTSLTMGLLLTLTLATTSLILTQGTIAYPNIVYAFYYFSAILFFVDFIRKKENFFLFLGCLLLGFAVLVRPQEPFWVVPLVLISPFILKENKVKVFIFSLITFFFLRQLWFLYRASVFNWQVKYFQIVYQIDSSRIFESLRFLTAALLKDYFPFLLFFLLGVSNLIKSNRATLFLFGIISLDIMILFVGTYFFTFNYPDWRSLDDSVRRIGIFFMPLFLYFCLSMLREGAE